MRGALGVSKAIEAFVGPKGKRTCLEWQDGSPSPDWIYAMVMVAHNRWPDMILKQMTGVGTLDINYQLRVWKSKEYHTIEELVRQHYASLGIEESVHSIEVYARDLAEVIIGTLSKKDKLALIGKSGGNVSNLRKKIKAKMGKYWQVSVQVLT